MSPAYLAAVTLISAAAALTGFYLQSQALSECAGILALYGLHVASLRSMTAGPEGRRAAGDERPADTSERLPIDIDPDSPTARRTAESRNWWSPALQRQESLSVREPRDPARQTAGVSRPPVAPMESRARSGP